MSFIFCISNKYTKNSINLRLKSSKTLEILPKITYKNINYIKLKKRERICKSNDAKICKAKCYFFIALRQEYKGSIHTYLKVELLIIYVKFEYTN
jgi:hypothetical protein